VEEDLSMYQCAGDAEADCVQARLREMSWPAHDDAARSTHSQEVDNKVMPHIQKSKRQGFQTTADTTP